MHLYNVPVIQQELRHEETIIQAVNALEYLQNVITDVFDRIDNRIESNMIRITNINSRIYVANQKVESLVGINKAINIFSPAKYPASDVFRDISKTFNSENPPQFVLKDDYQVASTLDPTHHKNMQEKLQFYHVKTESAEKLKINQILSTSDGLGNPPSNITSVNALLLFNTGQNLYENYKKVDPLNNVLAKFSSLTNQTSSPGMEPAPISLTNRTLKNKRFTDNLLYTPGVIEAPIMDLPIDLPDLPGIADDISYSIQENEPGIGPSFSAKPNIQLNLLTLPDPEKLLDEPIVIELPPEIIAVPVAPKKAEISAPPPPPPPPPLEIIQQKQNIVTKIPTPKLDEPDAARSNLMDSIRQAGGKAKLRSLEKKPEVQTDSKPVPTNNLMADLHNKLSMRRKGISGAKDGEKPGILDRVSAMIPPPQKTQNQNSTTDISDEDWE